RTPEAIRSPNVSSVAAAAAAGAAAAADGAFRDRTEMRLTEARHIGRRHRRVRELAALVGLNGAAAGRSAETDDHEREGNDVAGDVLRGLHGVLRVLPTHVAGCVPPAPTPKSRRIWVGQVAWGLDWWGANDPVGEPEHRGNYPTSSPR